MKKKKIVLSFLVILQKAYRISLEVIEVMQKQIWSNTVFDYCGYLALRFLIVFGHIGKIKM